MKKIILLIVLLSAFTFKSHAQKNVIKTNTLSLLIGVASIGYERAVSDKGALELVGSYYGAKVEFDSGDETAARGFGVEGKYKFYISREQFAPRGWYVAPAIMYVNASAESGTERGEVSLIGGGAVAGYQWVFGGGSTGFALDLNLGAQYVSLDVDGDIDGANLEGVLPKVGVSIGYSW